jgi:hypothetical protein
MGRKSAEIKKVVQKIDNDLLTDLTLSPSQLRSYYVDNVFSRSLAYLVGLTGEKKAITLKATKDGLLRTVQEELTYLKPPILVDFGRSFHKYITNWEELKAEIVNYVEEGIPLWNSTRDNGYGLKFILNAGETKILRIPIVNVAHSVSVLLVMYQTGDVKSTLQGGNMGSNPVGNVNNEWILLTGRNEQRGIWIEFTSENGGAVYISAISIVDNDVKYGTACEIGSYPAQILDGTTTYTYDLTAYAKGDEIYKFTVYIAGDGTNAINVDVNVYTVDGWKTVATFSQIASTTGVYVVYIPSQFALSWEDTPLVQFQFVVSGYGEFLRYEFEHFKQNEIVFKLNGIVTASASELTTTVTRYTLIDNNGIGNRYDNGSVSLDGTTGTAILYINGAEVLDASGTTGTFSIPSNWLVYKIEVDLAGDATTSATASFEGLEWKGKYLLAGV